MIFEKQIQCLLCYNFSGSGMGYIIPSHTPYEDGNGAYKVWQYLTRIYNEQAAILYLKHNCIQLKETSVYKRHQVSHSRSDLPL